MSKHKSALLSGVSGQDGYYLSRLLLAKGYEVYGLVRRTSKVSEVPDGVKVIWGDLTDQGSLNHAVIKSMPDEVYNLGAQSFVGGSWDYPVSTADITGLGALRLLEAIRLHAPKAKFYQASSSEMYGNYTGLLNETSPFKPRSPYGVAKLFAHQIAVNYRESYGMFVCCGILFNHESPKRGKEFVTQKIIQGVKAGELSLGNLESRRDWGYAGDYVQGMWQMMQQNKSDDYVLATGKSHSIQEFLDMALSLSDYEVNLTIDPTLFRPAEINDLRGDYSKAKRILGWEPVIGFEELVSIMLEGDDDDPLL